MTRRSVFTLVPAASALVALRSHGAPITGPLRTAAGFAIAVQCWSFRKFTVWQAVEMSAAAGAAGLELFPGQRLGGPHGDLPCGPGMPDEVIGSLLEHCRAHQVAPVNFGVTPVAAAEAEARKLFEFARKLGLYGVTTESLDALDTLEKLAGEYDLKVCFHNHPKPTALWHPDKVWQAVEGRHPNLGYCADLGHWASSALDPLEVIRKIAPRVHAFHMKDRESIAEPTHDRPFGTGVIRLAAILDQVRKHGFAGNVSIEYEHNWDSSLAEVAQCVGFLRGYAGSRAQQG